MTNIDQLQARIDNLTRQLKEENSDSEFARLWDQRAALIHERDKHLCKND